MATSPYPVQLSVDYPDRQLNRLTSALRIFTAIPILMLCAAAVVSVSGKWINKLVSGLPMRSIAPRRAWRYRLLRWAVH